jgi:predicted N-acetyltransferase YhbS
MRRALRPGLALNSLSLTILPEQPDDGPAIEKLYERTFGPGRFARTAYRLRERMAHRRELSFTARIGTLLVGSVRLTPIRIGNTRAMLLGPLTVEPPFREHGIGRSLIDATLKAARAAGVTLVLLVGDEPYYAASGFKRVTKGRAMLPGPVDPERVLVAELVAGAFEGVEGHVRPDYEAAASP